MHQFLKFIFGIKLYMFRTVPLPIISSFSLYTQQRYRSYRLQLQLASRIRTELQFRPDPAPKLSANRCCVYSEKTADDGQRNCPKHVEFYSKNKFEKLVHLVDRLCGLVVRISGYRYRGSGFDPRRYQIFWVVVLLERGPLSLVRSNWDATWIKKVAAPGSENRD